PGPGRRGERRGAGFGPRLRRRRGGDDRADGAVAAGADPGVPRAAVRHAASGRALPGTSAGVVNGRGEPAWLVAMASRGRHSGLPEADGKNNTKAGLSRNSTVRCRPGTLIPGRVEGRLRGPFRRDLVTRGECRNQSLRGRRELGDWTLGGRVLPRPF